MGVSVSVAQLNDSVINVVESSVEGVSVVVRRQVESDDEDLPSLADPPPNGRNYFELAPADFDRPKVNFSSIE